MLCVQGSSARFTPETKQLPIDAAVIGIVDQVQVGSIPSSSPGRTRDARAEISVLTGNKELTHDSSQRTSHSASRARSPRATRPADRRDGQQRRAAQRRLGCLSTVDDAVAAANDGFKKLRDRSLADRAKAVACVYRLCDEQAAELGRLELEETKIGRLDHKIEKLQIAKLVPGIEFLKCDAPAATTVSRSPTTPRSA